MRLMRHALEERWVRDAVTETPIAVIAAGKASEGMVRGLLETPGVRIARGIAVGPGASTTGPGPITWYAAGHPVPNSGSIDAGRAALRCAAQTGPSERLLVLLSGGASALMAAPVAGLTLAEKIEATRLLLRSGVPIHELNCVRKHLSNVKGGRVALAARGPMLTLAISDVVSPLEDDPSVIGSGPTVPDRTTYAEALEVVTRPTIGGRMPAAVFDVLERGCAGMLDETFKSGDARVEATDYRVIGNRRQAMEGALTAAQGLGYAVALVDTPVTGEARLTGPRHVERLLGLCRRLQHEREGAACAVSSGETTVTLTGGGRGGRNQEMALAAVSLLKDHAGTVFASVGTDGVDGPTDAAGAVVDTTTMARASRAGLAAPSRYLATNDSYRFFDPLGDLIKTGPSGTNVGDLQIVLTDGTEGQTS